MEGGTVICTYFFVLITVYDCCKLEVKMSSFGEIFGIITYGNKPVMISSVFMIGIVTYFSSSVFLCNIVTVSFSLCTSSKSYKLSLGTEGIHKLSR